ncbi:50S ribosomal protein L15 [archaeon]|nr:MAG: 50S ribosomal protein L15 [archaeon]RLG66134.1 MAG: 50S ribosomal protein L15 [archaeon]HDM23602.1 50S ribosomal protein L15 [Candidatus Bathyarchaeota archaeon]
MPHRLRKTRKMRGSRTCGYGRIQQHRRGKPRGKAGMHKHLWIYTIKYKPDHFGKHGFKRPQEYEYKAINIEECEMLARKYGTKEGEYIVLDLTKLGYEKVLGRGKVNMKLKVIAKYFTKKAIEKIEAAGGEVVRAS